MDRRQTDPEVLRLERELLAAIERGAFTLAEEIAAQIEARGSNGTIQDTGTLTSLISAALATWFVTFAQDVRTTQVQIATHMVDRELEKTIPILRSAGATANARTTIQRQMEQYPRILARTFYKRPNDADGIPFDERIKTVRLGSEQTVRNIINVGKRRGQSAQQIAADVKVYLRGENGGPGRPLNATELQREAANLSGTSKPRNISKNKLPYSAMRIARSESGNTYRAAEVEMYKNTPFEEDPYDWLLSNSHSDPDNCDELARRSPYSGKRRPKSHPHCMCSFAKRPVSVDELKRRLEAAGML